jgi:arylsulfatase
VYEVDPLCVLAAEAKCARVHYFGESTVWKVVFLLQEHEGLDVWKREFTKLRAPNIYDILGDPFERGDASMYYNQWFVEHVPMQYAASALVGQWLQSFKEFPVRQKPASFNLDEVMRKLSETPGAGK